MLIPVDGMANSSDHHPVTAGQSWETEWLAGSENFCHYYWMLLTEWSRQIARPFWLWLPFVWPETTRPFILPFQCSSRLVLLLLSAVEWKYDWLVNHTWTESRRFISNLQQEWQEDDNRYSMSCVGKFTVVVLDQDVEGGISSMGRKKFPSTSPNS